MSLEASYTPDPRFDSLVSLLQKPGSWDALFSGAGQQPIGVQDPSDRVQRTLEGFMHRLTREPDFIDSSRNPTNLLWKSARRKSLNAFDGEKAADSLDAMATHVGASRLSLPGEDKGDIAEDLSRADGEFWRDLETTLIKQGTSLEDIHDALKLLIYVFVDKEGHKRKELAAQLGLQGRALDNRVLRARKLLQKAATDPSFREMWLEK